MRRIHVKASCGATCKPSQTLGRPVTCQTLSLDPVNLLLTGIGQESPWLKSWIGGPTEERPLNSTLTLPLISPWIRERPSVQMLLATKPAVVALAA